MPTSIRLKDVEGVSSDEDTKLYSFGPVHDASELDQMVTWNQNIETNPWSQASNALRSDSI